MANEAIAGTQKRQGGAGEMVDGRYTLGRLLGETGHSAVYAATDPAGMGVCVKILKVQDGGRVDPEARVRFRQEAELLARLSHPNVVKVYGLGEHQGGLYLAMELLKGNSLDTVVKAQPMELGLALRLLHQVAEGLAYVHRHGVVHRDLKPANVFMVGEGADANARIIDFGFAGATQALARANDRAVIGTLRYMAPEQAGLIQRPVGPRSDLYAVGCIAYELLCGKPAFDAPDEGALLRMVQAEMPTRLRKLMPSIPVVLEKIIDKLVQKNPDDRYQTADGLMEDLAHVSADVKAGKAAALFDLDSGSRLSLAMTGNIFVGRESELAKTDALLDGALAGQPQLLLVGGRSGVGKSAFVGEVLNRGRVRGLNLAAGKCYAMHTGFPYYALAEALGDAHALLEHHSGEDRARLEKQLVTALGASAGELVRLAPVWRDVFKETTTLQYEGEAKDRERFTGMVASLLRALATKESPVAMFIDDLQWADAGTIDLLAALLDRLKGAQVLLVGTYRSEEVSESHPLERLRKPANAGEIRALSFELGPLSSEETRSLLEKLFGPAATAPLVEAVHNRSGGNAFFTWELLRAFAHVGVIQIKNGEFALDMSVLESAKLPANLLDVVLRRLSSLPPQSQQALGAAALLGSAFSFSLVKTTLQVTDDEAYVALRVAEQEQLIVEVGHAYVFAHDKILEACARFVQEKDAPRLHRLIGQHLEDSLKDAAGEEAAERVFDLAHHFSRGDDPDKALKYSQLAGDRARKLMQNDRALEAYTQADKVLADRGVPELDDSRVELLVRRSDVLDTMGKYDQAHVGYERALTVRKEPLKAAQLLSKLAGGQQKGGQLTKSHENLVAALQLLGVRLQLDRKTLGVYLWIEKVRLYLATAVAWMRGQRTAQPNERDSLTLELLTRLWYIHSFHDVGVHNEKMYYLAYRLLSRALPMGNCKELSIAHRLMSITLCQGNAPDFEGAIKHSFMCVEVARRLQLKMELAVGYCYVGAVHVWQAKHAEAVQYLKKSQEFLEQIGNQWELVNTHIMLFMAYRNIGKLDEALSHSLEIVKIAEKTNASGSLASGSLKVGELLLFKGDGERAQEYLQRALRIAEEKKLNFDSFMANKVHGMLRTRDGAFAEGRGFLEKAMALNDRNNFLRAYVNEPAIAWADSVVREAAAASPSDRAALEPLLEKAKSHLDRALQQEERYLNHLPYALRVQARLLHLRGDTPGALMAVRRAEVLAEAPGREWERPQVLETEADVVASTDADKARSIYLRARELYASFGAQGEVNRLKPLLKKVGFAEESQERAVEAAKVQLEALLEVSLASASTLDPAKQSRAALDELVRVFGAERAFLFHTQVGKDDLIMMAGRDSQKNDLPSTTEYSSTAVEKVRSTKAPLVVTGSGQGALLGSESAVVYNLRSIMAAPLMVRDSLVGVVYLDNKLEKGMRTKTDVLVLQAISNHIAIALESARQARLELERQTLQNEKALMEKDLAVTAAVQTLFLPRQQSLTRQAFDVTGYYRPAAQCGGDWWWMEEAADGTIVILVGDVTGHGPGAAMVTASVATAYRIFTRLNPQKGLPEAMAALNEELSQIAQGKYHMTMAALQLNLKTGRVDMWNAGAPPLMVHRAATGKVEVVGSPGTPLGNEGLKLGSATVTLTQGDRVLIYTDGLPELDLPNGKMLGPRKLSTLFAQGCGNRDLPAATLALVAEMDRARQDVAQADDLTFVLAAWQPPAP